MPKCRNTENGRTQQLLDEGGTLPPDAGSGTRTTPSNRQSEECNLPLVADVDEATRSEDPGLYMATELPQVDEFEKGNSTLVYKSDETMENVKEKEEPMVMSFPDSHSEISNHRPEKAAQSGSIAPSLAQNDHPRLLTPAELCARIESLKARHEKEMGTLDHADARALCEQLPTPSLERIAQIVQHFPGASSSLHPRRPPKTTLRMNRKDHTKASLGTPNRYLSKPSHKHPSKPSSISVKRIHEALAQHGPKPPNSTSPKQDKPNSTHPPS